MHELLGYGFAGAIVVAMLGLVWLVKCGIDRLCEKIEREEKAGRRIIRGPKR